MKKINLPQEVKPLLIIILSLAISVLFTYSITLGAGEAGEQEITNLIYFFSILAVVSSFVILLMHYTRKFWKGDDKYGNGFGFYNIGKSGALRGLKNFSALQLTILSLIFFGFIFLFSNIGRSLTGLRTLPQQFTTVQSLSFSSLLIPMAEELFSLAVMGIFVFLLIIFAKRYNLSKGTYQSLYFGLIPLLIGIMAILWHKTTYSGSDISLGIVFIFWVVKTILVLGSGLFLVGWALHLNNNFFVDATGLYSSDLLFGVVVVVLIALSVLYIWIYRKNNAWYRGIYA